MFFQERIKIFFQERVEIFFQESIEIFFQKRVETFHFRKTNQGVFPKNWKNYYRKHSEPDRGLCSAWFFRPLSLGICPVFKEAVRKEIRRDGGEDPNRGGTI